MPERIGLLRVREVPVAHRAVRSGEARTGVSDARRRRFLVAKYDRNRRGRDDAPERLRRRTPERGGAALHRITVAQNLGATQLTIADTVETPGGTTLATQSFARNLCSVANAVGPCAAQNALYAISGTTDRTLIRADGGLTVVRYIIGTPGPLAASVASCPQAYCLPASGRAPGSVGFEYAIAASPQASDVGTELAWLEPGTTPTTNAATLVSGMLTAGSFTADATGLVTLGELAGTATTTAVFPL